MESNEDSQLVCIELGPTRHAMLITREHFCQLSRVFRDTGIYGQFSEAARRNKPIWLPDTDVDDFTAFVTWMYSDTFKPTPSIAYRSESIWMQVQFWVEAGKINVPKLQNQILDHIAKWCVYSEGPSFPTEMIIWFIHHAGWTQDDQLSHMLTYSIARSMRAHTAWVGTAPKSAKSLVAEVEFYLKEIPGSLQGPFPSSNWHVPDQSKVLERTDENGRAFLQVCNPSRQGSSQSASEFDSPYFPIREINNQLSRARRQPQAYHQIHNSNLGVPERPSAPLGTMLRRGAISHGSQRTRPQGFFSDLETLQASGTTPTVNLTPYLRTRTSRFDNQHLGVPHMPSPSLSPSLGFRPDSPSNTFHAPSPGRSMSQSLSSFVNRPSSPSGFLTLPPGHSIPQSLSGFGSMAPQGGMSTAYTQLNRQHVGAQHSPSPSPSPGFGRFLPSGNSHGTPPRQPTPSMPPPSFGHFPRSGTFHETQPRQPTQSVPPRSGRQPRLGPFDGTRLRRPTPPPPSFFGSVPRRGSLNETQPRRSTQPRPSTPFPRSGSLSPVGDIQDTQTEPPSPSPPSGHGSLPSVGTFHATQPRPSTPFPRSGSLSPVGDIQDTQPEPPSPSLPPGHGSLPPVGTFHATQTRPPTPVPHHGFDPLPSLGLFNVEPDGDGDPVDSS